MQGKRHDFEDKDWETMEKGDYGKCLTDGEWYGRVPADNLSNFGLCGLQKHSVTEHEDGTITVSPSILTWDSNGNQWHGFLEKGIWRAV